MEINNNMNGQAFINVDGVNDINNWLWSVKLDAPFTDYRSWYSSLMWYPINFLANGTQGYLKIGKTSTTIEAWKLPQFYVSGSKSYRPNVYWLGQLKVPNASSFLDYEPYSKIRIWLPYYGIVNDIKPSDIMGKYMQFRLIVDYTTGVGQYVIGVTNTSLEKPGTPYIISQSYDYNTRIIAMYSVQLGVQCPISSDGTADVFTNVAMGALKLGVGVAASVASGSIFPTVAATSSVTTTTTTTPRYSPTTGRILTRPDVVTETVATDSRQMVENRENPITTGMQMANQVISNLNISPTIQGVQGANMMSNLKQTIRVEQYRAKPNEALFGTNLALYGAPVDKNMVLFDCQGFTKVSWVKITDAGLNLATEPEKRMIEALLKNGVYINYDASSVSEQTLDQVEKARTVIASQ